jgi:hypothetical protein
MYIGTKGPSFFQHSYSSQIEILQKQMQKDREGFEAKLKAQKEESESSKRESELKLKAEIEAKSQANLDTLESRMLARFFESSTPIIPSPMDIPSFSKGEYR